VIRRSRFLIAIAALALLAPAAARPLAAAEPPSSSAPAAAAPETLEFVPVWTDEEAAITDAEPARDETEWLRAPFGDALITDREQWRTGGRAHRARLLLDYNRVDLTRLGLQGQLQSPEGMAPRLGARLEYAFGRERLLYGFQIEQPIVPPGRIAVGVSMVRRTDHNELQQVDDAENTLALLLSRFDYRDYFEREGFGAYLAWRVPDFSTVSIHVRRDEYRSLPLDPGTDSWFHHSRPLRDNPAIDPGEARSVALRLERATRARGPARAGLYHWAQLEWADHGLGGDFEYARFLGDLRSVLRLSPAATLMLRFAAGHTAGGTLPAQKEFVVGGVDGLRAHAFSEYRGDQMVLAQAEYSVGIWRLRHGSVEGGLDVLAFVDAGRAWRDPRNRFSLGPRHIDVDGGFGLATAADRLRVYVARDLQRPGADVVVSVRLHRPF
jgi:hypothetical protein